MMVHFVLRLVLLPFVFVVFVCEQLLAVGRAPRSVVPAPCEISVDGSSQAGAYPRRGAHYQGDDGSTYVMEGNSSRVTAAAVCSGWEVQTSAEPLSYVLLQNCSNSETAPARAYHQEVIDHFEKPLNVGSLDKNDANVGTGLVGAPACGDVMKLQIQVDEDGNITDAKFKTFGCGSAIASSSVASEWVKGRNIKIGRAHV